MLLLKKVKDPVIDLCAPPVKDITYANGHTGEIKGPLTSVISSNKCGALENQSIDCNNAYA